MTYIDLRFTDACGRQQVVYAAMRDSGTWDVRGIVDGRPFARECDRWQAVERAVLWLRRHGQDPAPAPPHRSGVVAAVVGLLVLFGAGGLALAEQPAASPAIQAFIDATREYAALHRRVEAALPALEVTTNPQNGRVHARGPYGRESGGLLHDCRRQRDARAHR